VRENEVVDGMNRADPRAFEELVRLRRDIIVGVLWKILGNAADVDDAFQDVLWRLWRNMPSLGTNPGLGGYVRRTAMSAGIDILRARRRRQRIVSALDMQVAAGEDPVSPELKTLLRMEVAKLPRKASLAFIMRHYDGASYDKIADTLGCSEAAARSHVSKAVKRLRKRMSRYL